MPVEMIYNTYDAISPIDKITFETDGRILAYNDMYSYEITFEELQGAKFVRYTTEEEDETKSSGDSSSWLPEIVAEIVTDLGDLL